MRRQSPKEALDAGRPTDALWNPRYVQYARAHGVADPDRMLEIDVQRFPGGRMAGFIAWMSDRLAAWHKLKGGPREFALLTESDHVAFDAWLVAEVDWATSVIPSRARRVVGISSGERR